MHTIQWFKEKFQNIGGDRWKNFILRESSGCCVLGHCGVEEADGSYLENDESRALSKIFRGVFPNTKESNTQILFHVNDGTCLFGNGNLIPTLKLGITPKERIMKVLEMAEDLENKELMEANIRFVKEEIIETQLV